MFELRKRIKKVRTHALPKYLGMPRSEKIEIIEHREILEYRTSVSSGVSWSDWKEVPTYEDPEVYED